MMKRYLIVFILLAFALSGCSGELSVLLEFPPDKLQEKLDEKFPISTTELEESAPLEVLLSEPQPILEEGKDQIGIRLKADVIPPTLELPQAPSLPKPGSGQPSPQRQTDPLSGYVTIFVSLRYDPEQRAIYLSEPKITDLAFEQLPDALSEPVSRAIEQVLAEKFAEDPIFLPQDEALVQAATAVMKSVVVKNGKLLIEFGL